LTGCSPNQRPSKAVGALTAIEIGELKWKDQEQAAI